MNAKRFNTIMIGIFILLVAACIGLTVYANMWLTQRSKQLINTKLDTLALEQKQKASQKAQSVLEENGPTQEMLEKIVPKSKDQAKTVAELLTISKETGVTINSITFPSSELGAVVKPVTGADGSTAQTPTTSSVTQAKPVEGISGLLGIAVTISQIDRQGGESGSGISYDQMIKFIESIEKNRRTMQIKTLQIQPLQAASGNGIGGYSLTLSLNIFVKP